MYISKTHTIYGLSLIASLLCASATRRLASATRRARSSGVPEPDAGVAGVGPLDTVGDGVTLDTTFDGRDAGRMGTLSVGAAIPVVALVAEAAGTRGFFMAASLAAISARFWAIRSAPDNLNQSRMSD